MNETKYRMTITNLDEAQKKADELVRTLQQAKQLIRDISEMSLGVESTEISSTIDDSENVKPDPACNAMRPLSKKREIQEHYQRTVSNQ